MCCQSQEQRSRSHLCAHRRRASTSPATLTSGLNVAPQCVGTSCAKHQDDKTEQGGTVGQERKRGEAGGTLRLKEKKTSRKSVLSRGRCRKTRGGGRRAGEGGGRRGRAERLTGERNSVRTCPAWGTLQGHSRAGEGREGRARQHFGIPHADTPSLCPGLATDVGKGKYQNRNCAGRRQWALKPGPLPTPSACTADEQGSGGSWRGGEPRRSGRAAWDGESIKTDSCHSRASSTGT